MTNVISGTAALLFFILPVIGLLAWAGWRDRRRERLVARQIRLSDAIAAELGAIVAPVVSKPLGGTWRVAMRVPVGRPAMVARILAIAHDTLTRIDGAGYELVLTADSAAGRAVTTAPRRLRAA